MRVRTSNLPIGLFFVSLFLPLAPPVFGAAGGIQPGLPWTYEPSVAFTELGYSVSTAGDVNGDGYSDVIVGAHRYDGLAGTDQGQAYVFHGSASGTSATPSWTANPSAANSRFGWRVATAGDLNGDGYDDVVVGTTSSSRVYVYYGSPTGLPAAASLELVGGAGEAFGYAVSTAGDVNADGYDDLFVGGYAYGGSGVLYGRVALHLGSPAGVSATPAWGDTGDVTNELLGFSVAPAGDVNGDGYADVLAGSYAWDPTGSISIQLGRASCYAGSASGQLTRIWTAEGSANGMRLGESLAGVGDVNGDGYADILIGAPSRNSNTGWAQMHYGSATGPSLTPSQTHPGGPVGDRFAESVAPAGDVDGDGYADWLISMPRRSGNNGEVHLYRGEFDGSAGVVWTQVGPTGSFFGQSAGTAGDVNGDGFSDIVIGAPFTDNGQDNEGRAYVYRGRSGDFGGVPFLVDDGGIGGRFGASVASAGDVNADGYADLLVGAPDWDIGRGRISLHLGGDSGTSPTASWVAHGSQAFEFLGSSVSDAGDVNGDGYDDFLVGAPEFDAEVVPVIGRARLYYGGPGLPSHSGWEVGGFTAGDRCGYAVAGAGDVNGDGYADLLVGCPWTDSSGLTDNGSARLYLGSAAGPSPSAAWITHGVFNKQHHGRALAGAGDVDRDGYDDVLIGAPGSGDSLINAAELILYRGGPAGLSTIPAMVIPGGAWSSIGASVAGAGDVNGDGYADMLIGDPTYRPYSSFKPGRVLLYYGGAGALSGVDWIYQGPFHDESVGAAVAGAGDVNGDGFSDILIGAPGAGVFNDGRVVLFLGSATGPGTEPDWESVGSLEVRLGAALAGLGDANGDGFGDAVLAEPRFEPAGSPGAVGRVRIHHGNAVGVAWEPGIRNLASLAEEWSGAPARDGNALAGNALRVGIRGQGPGGRTRVRLEWQAAPVGTALSSVPIQSGEWIDTGPVSDGGSAVALDELLEGLPIESEVHLRWRLATRSPFFPHTHWLTPDDVIASLAHFRTGTVSGVGDEPEAGGGPGVAAGTLALRAFPNPFSASGLEVRFDNPSAGRVRAEVFDVLGRRLAVAADAPHAAGSTVLRWDGRLDGGAPAPRGVYFVRVSAGAAVGVTRVVRVGAGG
jgi:hypothetical protein